MQLQDQWACDVLSNSKNRPCSPSRLSTNAAQASPAQLLHISVVCRDAGSLQLLIEAHTCSLGTWKG
jgi:hypothetical protein